MISVIKVLFNIKGAVLPTVLARRIMTSEIQQLLKYAFTISEDLWAKSSLA